MDPNKRQTTMPNDSDLLDQIIAPTWFPGFKRLGSPVLRQCLSYRGVIPIMPTAELASSVELLAYAIGYAKANGLVSVGDRVVVSQCPRKDNSDVMEEAGVVSLVQVTE